MFSNSMCSVLSFTILARLSREVQHRFLCNFVILVVLTTVFHCAKPRKAKGEGKDRPRTGQEGPEGEQRYSSTLSLTYALDLVGVKRHLSAALSLGKRPGTHIIGSWVWTVWTGAGKFSPTGIRSPDRPARSESLYRLIYSGSNVVRRCVILDDKYAGDNIRKSV